MQQLLSDHQLTTFRAILDRIIPADDFPAATGAGVDQFILRLLKTDAVDDLPAVRDGLDAIDAEAKAQNNQLFTKLTESQRDDLLKKIEAGDVKAAWGPPPAMWFTRVIAMAMEGFYSDPGNGGNLNEVSWKMIGYDPGASRHV
jgi:hypothetical protein